MYFITTKRMLEVCFSAHPNIQYRTIITFYLGLLILRCGGNYGDQFRLSVFCLPASSCRASHSAKYGLMTLKGAGPISRRKRLNSMLV